MVSFSPFLDESARLAHLVLPDHTPLESWGDARAWDGTIGIIQPLILPLFEGFSPLELLAMMVDDDKKTTKEKTTKATKKKTTKTKARG